MPDFSPDQIRELDSLTAPRPEYDLNGLVGLDTGLNLKMPGPTDLVPYQAIPAGQGYQMQPDPMYLGQSDGTDDMNGLGLDISVSGQSQPGWIDALKGAGGALEALSAGYFGREPLFMKMQLQERQIQAQSELRKQMIAQQAQRLEEEKRQHMFQQVATIDKEFANEPEKWQAAMQQQIAAGNPFAQTMLQAGSKQMAGDFEEVASTFKKLYPDLAEKYGKNPASVSPATMRLALKASHDYSVETRKATIEEKAKQDRVQGILTRFKENPDSLSDTDLDLVDKFYKAQDERKIKQEELKRRVTNLGLEGQQKQQELARGKAPIVSPGYVTSGGETEHIITDPATGQRKTVSGVPMNRTQTQDLDPKFTPEQAARVSAMNMTLNNVSDLRDKLVPDGKTVDRRVLFTSMFGGLPFTEGRDVERFIEDAIETKLRLQTGAAANKDEVKKEAAKFKPNQLDSDETIVGKFDKLERYMQDTFNVLDPSGVVRARLGAAGGNIGAPPIPFDTAYEDLKKKRPNWNQKEIFRELQRRGVKPE